MPAPGDSATILVVDDDRAVRTLVRNCLDASGYVTLAAGSGEEAFQVFAERQSEVALLLTDIVMPGIDGLHLARRIREMRPGLPVIVMSAYCGRLQEQNEFVFLAKPFLMAELLSCVTDMLIQKKEMSREEAGNERRLKSG